MRHHPWRLLSSIAAVALLAASTEAAEPIDYARDIKPILKSRCYACHGALKQESGLRLDSGHLIRQGGDSGASVTPGKPDESLLLERVSASDAAERMPPEGEPLKAEQIQALRHWISQGAPSPDDEQPEQDPRRHWAFRPAVRPAIPQVAHGQSLPNPIDAFIAQQHAQHGLAPQPLAEKHVLLRRVYLDLIGLPPTREELHAFLADDSPQAYVRVVDRLLESPQYGERWARHWMDVWRYSDWYGRRNQNDVRNSASQIWRWRDWIVRSLNEDHGYDRMVREMLAADEICPEDDEAAVATGYLIRNFYSLNPNDWMRSTVEHTGKAFLGLTFNCAHCHDHKYDPIAQEDYFRLRAFFEPIYVRQDRVPGEADPGPFQDYTYGGSRKVQRLGAVRIFDKTPQAPTWFYTGGDERNRVKERGSTAPGVPAFLAEWLPEIESIELPPRAWYPGLRPAIQETILDDARAAITQAQAEIVAAEQASAKPSSAVRDQLALAEATYDAAVREAEQAGRPGALVGQQSLVLDATTGRRIVQNGLQQLQALEDGSTLEFQLLICSDAHVNFQFAKDVVKGLTAGYVAFEQGKIVSYQPGSFTEFEAGHYDFARGQKRFLVKLVLQTSSDRCLLTVRSLSDEKPLVAGVPVALNGWNPVGDASQAISFDARTGSVAVIDEVILTAPAAVDVAEGSPPPRLACFDFEPPAYPDGSDVVGIQGWLASSFSVAPATSTVSATAGNESLRRASQNLQAARRAARVPTLRIQAAQSKLVAARAELSSLQARIAADRAQYGETPGADAKALARAASRLEREAAVRTAEAGVLAREHALAEVQAKPADKAQAGKQLDAATKALSAARAARDKARAALTDDTRAETYTAFSPVYPRTSTGRRRALAEWITNPHNPLTARVAVNHIWMRHFHVPLVDSVYDFGRNGAAPTHPQLLDWLAVEFMESAWSMKHLHRLIVTSAAYRRRSSATGAVQWTTLDPENKLLWRMNTGRMESEVVRDSLLYCAGRLNLHMGGQELENEQALTTSRRSLYYSVYPEDGGTNPLGELFDPPDALDCYRRTRSIVPQQALVLTNSDFVHRLSSALADTLRSEIEAEGNSRPSEQSAEVDETDPGDRFVVAAFERILSRVPSELEMQVCSAFLAKQAALIRQRGAANEQAARESLVRALLNHNDFVTIR